MGSSPLGGCIGSFLKILFSNFRFYIKDSKWCRKCIFINCTSCNGSQFTNGKLPHSRCRAFWAHVHRWVHLLHFGSTSSYSGSVYQPRQVAIQKKSRDLVQCFYSYIDFSCIRIMRVYGWRFTLKHVMLSLHHCRYSCGILRCFRIKIDRFCI